MRAIVKYLAIVCLLGSASVARADLLGDLEKEQRALFQKVAPAVVYIISSEGVGSGFFVRDHLIVTNAHVVGSHAKIDVVTQSGKKLQGRVIARAPRRVDLVLVQVEYASPQVLQLGTESLSIGTWVASVGHGVDSPWTFTTGMVSNIFKKDQSRPVFQTQIPLNPGNSGGPIFDRKGAVIGVVTSGIKESNSVNFAIHSAELIKAFPDQLSGECACLRIEAPRGAPIMVDGEFAGVGPSVLVPVGPGKHEITATIRGAIEVRSASYPKVKKVVFR